MLLTRYITLDEFQDYFSLDLVEEFGTVEKATAFLVRIENRMVAFVNANFNRNIDLEYPTFSDYQKEHYKLALKEQAIYIWRNGDVSVDSGYELETGEKISRSKVKEISIAPNCENELRLCGIWNRNLRSSRCFDIWYMR